MRRYPVISPYVTKSKFIERRDEVTLSGRLLKKASSRLLKKTQKRGARKIDEWKRTYSTLQRGRLRRNEACGSFSVAC